MQYFRVGQKINDKSFGISKEILVALADVNIYVYN